MLDLFTKLIHRKRRVSFMNPHMIKHINAICDGVVSQDEFIQQPD